MLQLGKRKNNIGILTPGYGLEKVSYGIQPKEFNYIKVNRIPINRIVHNDSVFSQCPYIVGGPSDIIHSFNMLPLNKNFVLSYETEIPRFLGNPSSKSLNFGYDILQSDRCRGIYALSDAGRKFAQRRMIDRGLVDLANTIKVFRGGFDMSQNTAFQRPTKGPIQACFVGGHMFHKGIEATIQAIQALRDGGVEIELTVVGKAIKSTYAASGISFDQEGLLKTFTEKSWITHFTNLRNKEVIALFQKSHVCLFPSIDESLGWVLVEAGMNGIPRLATNIYAFPELIDHGLNGWMIDLPLNEDGRWAHLEKSSVIDEWHETKSIIFKKMVEYLGNSAISIDKLIAMGVEAKKKTSNLYALPKAKKELSDIYRKAIR